MGGSQGWRWGWERKGEGLSFKPASFLSGPLAFLSGSGPLHPGASRQWAHTCGSYSSEVVGPAEHHAGPVAGALNQGPGQGREQEDHGQVQHRHEQGEVEALRGAGARGRLYSPPAPEGSPPPPAGGVRRARQRMRGLGPYYTRPTAGGHAGSSGPSLVPSCLLWPLPGSTCMARAAHYQARPVLPQAPEGPQLLFGGSPFPDLPSIQIFKGSPWRGPVPSLA